MCPTGFWLLHRDRRHASTNQQQPTPTPSKRNNRASRPTSSASSSRGSSWRTGARSRTTTSRRSRRSTWCVIDAWIWVDGCGVWELDFEGVVVGANSHCPSKTRTPPFPPAKHKHLLTKIPCKSNQRTPLPGAAPARWDADLRQDAHGQDHHARRGAQRHDREREAEDPGQGGAFFLR